MARKQEISLSEITGLFKEGLNRAVTRPTIHGYVPHEKQRIFHNAREKGRLYIGGNRSGKTVGGIVEDIWRMRGQHPFQPVPPPPTRGRIVTVSYTEGIEMIIKPEIAKWLPPSDLINGSWEDSYNKQLRTLTLTNESTVELMSHDQKLEKFAGTSRHWTHFDEEPPKAIFDECKMRLIDTGGCWYITMTPVEGMTWVHDDLYEPNLIPGGNIAIIEIDSAENPYISEIELENALEGLTKEEKLARKEGKFVQLGGLVYNEFRPNIHVVDHEKIPLQNLFNWTQYASLDHGYNNPTAWLWHAVAPSGAVITFDEIYQNETLVSTFAKMIHDRNAEEHRRAPNIYVGDPAIAQRNAQTGDSIQLAYAQNGISIALGNNNVPIRVEKMNRYLRQGKWIITTKCPNLIRELQRVRWKIYDQAKKRRDNNAREEIHKHNDHAPDSAGYFFSMMPDLYLPNGSTPSVDPERINKVVQEAIGAVVPQMSGMIFDRNLRSPTRWNEYIDEHMGGEW